MRPTIQHALLIAALSPFVSLAQNMSKDFTSYCSAIGEPETCCPSFLNIDDISAPDAQVMSTGSVSFSPQPDQDPWKLSVLVNYTKYGYYSRESFLSVSDNTPDTNVCVYKFTPLNVTKSDNGSGCAGLLSDECMERLRQSLSSGSQVDWRVGGKCPSPPTGFFTNSSIMYDICRPLLDPDQQQYSRNRFVVPNDNCSYPSLPGIELPDNYQTPARGSSHNNYAMAGYGMGSGIYPPSTYDQFVSQVMPFAIVTSTPGEGNESAVVNFVCVTPDNIQPGMPAPKTTTPWEGSAGIEGRGVISGRIVVATAGLVLTNQVFDLNRPDRDA
ncbi:hypothetical protein OPT61_g7847 [Boeremia exigua]|uniref:Uncharacterized protein n=1 Tax=Boeremia exigua TaxID=749465 RepID=A0ACC2I2B5_9PLEO|nr:hypothetical protein OPT61_g7847 [Boeremia exigua]